MRPNKDRQNLWLWAALLLPLLWLAAGLAQITEQAHGLSALAAGLTALLNDPLNLRWCSSTPKFLLAVLVLYPLGVYCYLLDQADRRPGEEHGSAHWGIAKELNERYRNRKDPWQEIILSQNVRLSNDSYRHQRNLHVVVIGGSGSGKTRFYVKPNTSRTCITCEYSSCFCTNYDKYRPFIPTNYQFYAEHQKCRIGFIG